MSESQSMSISNQEWERVRLEAREGAFSAIKESMDSLRMAMREEAMPIAKQITNEHMQSCPVHNVAASNQKAIREVRLSFRKMIGLVVAASLGGGGISRLPDIWKFLHGVIQ